MMLHGQGERSGTCSLSTIPFNFRECFGGLGVQSEFPEPQRLGQKFWKIYVECPRPHTQGIKCVYIYPSFWEKMWMLFQNIWNHAIFFSKYIFFTEMKIFPSQREICALWKGPETIFLFSLILNYLTFPFFCCNFALFFWAPPPLLWRWWVAPHKSPSLSKSAIGGSVGPPPLPTTVPAVDLVLDVSTLARILEGDIRTFPGAK